MSNMTFSKTNKLKIKLARMQGQFIGTLKGILWWDIPSDLKEKIEKLIIELEKENYHE